jgi:hypothetical protein
MAAASQSGQQSGESSPADLLQQIKMVQGARRITATLRAPTDEIQKTFASRMSAGTEEPEDVAAFGSKPASEGSGKIRIYGLEEEPVEVDAGQP